MIPGKPQPSYATRRRWVMLGARSRIGAGSASMISTTRWSVWRQASRWPAACRCRSLSSRGAENLIRGRPDLDDTIKRLQAFEKAGADVLYAPGLRDLETMRTVVEAIGKPLNVVMSAADPGLTAAEMEAVGVKRLSVGGALSRLALAAFIKGAREMKEQGGFTWVRDALPTAELKAVFGA